MQNKLALLGFFILSYLLYRRLFKVRLPKEILPTNDILIIDINIFLCLSTFIAASILLYIYIKIILNKAEADPSTNPIIIKIKILLQSKYNPIPLLSDSLLALDIFIKNKIPYKYLDFVIMFISKHFCKYEKTFLFIFIFIPIFFQSIVIISFFMDVIFYHKFNYFYKYLWVLIFPLIAKYVIHSIKALVDTNLKSLENTLTLKVVKTSEYSLYQMNAPIFEVSVQGWKDILANTPRGSYLCMNSLSQEYLLLNPDIKPIHHEQILNYCIDSMNEYFIIYQFLDNYSSLKEKILLPFNVIKYFLYSFCWGYIVTILLELF